MLASCLDWFQLGMWAALRKESCQPDAYGCSKETCPSPISLAIQMNSWGTEPFHFTLSSGLCHFAGDMEGKSHISLTRWTKRPWGLCTSEKAGDPAGESVCLCPGLLSTRQVGAKPHLQGVWNCPPSKLCWGRVWGAYKKASHKYVLSLIPGICALISLCQLTFRLNKLLKMLPFSPPQFCWKIHPDLSHSWLHIWNEWGPPGDPEDISVYRAWLRDTTQGWQTSLVLCISGHEKKKNTNRASATYYTSILSYTKLYFQRFSLKFGQVKFSLAGSNFQGKSKGSFWPEVVSPSLLKVSLYNVRS